MFGLDEHGYRQISIEEAAVFNDNFFQVKGGSRGIRSDLFCTGGIGYVNIIICLARFTDHHMHESAGKKNFIDANLVVENQFFEVDTKSEFGC
jgi:hypothetical protein